MAVHRVRGGGSGDATAPPTTIPAPVWYVAASSDLRDGGGRRRRRTRNEARRTHRGVVRVRKLRYDPSRDAWAGAGPHAGGDGSRAAGEDGGGRNLFMEYVSLTSAEADGGGTEAEADFLSVQFGDGSRNRGRGGGRAGGSESPPNPSSSSPQVSYSYLADPAVESILRSGLRSPSGSTYHLLGCSNSQIRDASFLFRRSAGLGENESLIAGIIPGLDELERRKGVAKRVKYAGLLFSGVAEFVDLPEDASVREISSVEHPESGMDFTDGCGLMSMGAARLIKRAMGLAEVPSVVQIRHGGLVTMLDGTVKGKLCKGVLLLDPATAGGGGSDDRVVLSFRQSMLKVGLARDGEFVKVMKTKLGIVDVSRRRVGKLNQQPACLLSANIPRRDLLELQASHLDRVMACWHDPLAVTYLAAMEDDPTGHRWDRCMNLVLRKGDVEVAPGEGRKPRLPSHYVTLAQRRNRYCNEGGKLQIHLGCSRLLFGAALPELLHDFLAEGEVLVFTEAGPFVGTVIVSRSPSYCAGDVRVLEAVEPPPESPAIGDRLRNCVLFATRGDRPEADKMSGGDMDGDQYLVVWDPRLIEHAAALRREEAECYDPPPQPQPRPRSERGGRGGGAQREREDWIGYAARFDNSMLGVVDGAFHAIAKERGVKSEEARELNRLFSSLVDKNPASLRRLEELVGSCYLPGRGRATTSAEEQEEGCVWEEMLERQRACARRMQGGRLVPDAEDYARFRSALQGSNLVHLREGIIALSHHFESCVGPARVARLVKELGQRTADSQRAWHRDMESPVHDGADLDADFAIHYAAWERAAANVFAAPLAQWEKQRKGLLVRLGVERNRKLKHLNVFDKRRLLLKDSVKKCQGELRQVKKRLDSFDSFADKLRKDMQDVTDELNALSIFSLFSQKRRDLIVKQEAFNHELHKWMDRISKEERDYKALQTELHLREGEVDALDDELESFLSGKMTRSLQFELDRDEECLRLQRNGLAALERGRTANEEKIARMRDKEQKVADSLKNNELTASKLADFWKDLEAIVKRSTYEQGYFSRDMLSETSYVLLMRTAEKFKQWGNFWRVLGNAFIAVRTDDKKPENTTRNQDQDILREYFSCAVKAQDIIISEETKRQAMFAEASRRIAELKKNAIRLDRSRKDLKAFSKQLKKKQYTKEQAQAFSEEVRSRTQKDVAELQLAMKELKKKNEEANDLEKFLALSKEYRDAAAIALDGELVGSLPESIFMDIKGILGNDAATFKLRQKYESIEERGQRKKKDGCFTVPDNGIFFTYKVFVEDAKLFYEDQKSKLDTMIRTGKEELRNDRDEIHTLVENFQELKRACADKETEINALDKELIPRHKELSQMFCVEHLESLEDEWQDTDYEDSIDIGIRHIEHCLQMAKDIWYKELPSKREATALKLLLAELNADILRVCEIEENRVLGFPGGKKGKGERKERLIVYDKRAELQAVLSRSDVVVVTAGTGCGKSTQLPQYIADDFFTYRDEESDSSRKHARVCCTQPRRMAAQGVASRVAMEYQTEIGHLVGFRVGIRGNNVEDARKVSAKTRIEFVTEGWLLYHLTKSPSSLSNYDCIIVDEAHERNKETDLLLALLRHHLQEHGAPPLKVVVMSASIDPGKFCEYFGDCPSIDCPGKMHEVRDAYRPASPVEQSKQKGVIINTDHVVRVLFEDVLEKFGPQGNFERGDCLVFLSGSKQIEECVEKINALRKKKKLAVACYPLYAQMDRKDQDAATNKDHRSGIDGDVNGKHDYVRKVICCTNVAETSLTIDGVRFVLEGGHAKQLRYDHHTRCKGLVEEMISKASAKQRRGRAGRTESGWCFYLYSRDAHERMMKEYDKPQILETAVDELILYSLDVCGQSIEHIGLLDCPDDTDIAIAKERLCDLGMVVILDEDERISLTDDGKLACRLSSIDPEGARMVLAAQEPKLNCFHRALKLAVLMSSPDDIFSASFKINEEREGTDESCLKTHDLGDHLLALKWFEEFERRKGQMKRKGEKGLRAWCGDNGLIYHAMNRIQGLIEKCYKELKKRKKLTNVKSQKSEMADDERLLRACVAGYFSQIAECIDPSFPRDAGFTMLMPTAKTPITGKDETESTMSALQSGHLKLQLAKESCLNNLMIADEPGECFICEEGTEEDRPQNEGISIHFVLFGSLLRIKTSKGQLVLMENVSLINGQWIVEHAPKGWCDRVHFDPDKPSICRETITNIGKPLLRTVDEWNRQHENDDIVVKILWNRHQIRLYGSQECLVVAKQSILDKIEEERNVRINTDSAFYFSNTKEVPFHQQTSTEFGCGLTLRKVIKKQSKTDVSDLDNWFGRSVSPAKFDQAKYWNARRQGDKLTIFINRGWDSDMFHDILWHAVTKKSAVSSERHSELGSENLRIAQILFCLAQIFDEWGEDIDNAVLCIQEALFQMPKGISNDDGFSQLLHKIGLMFHKAGHPDMAIGFLNGQPLLRKQSPPSKQKFAQLLHSLGCEYHKNGDYSSALSFYFEALKIRKKVLRKGHLDVAMTSHNIGDALRMCESFDEALTFYEDSLRIRVKRLGCDNEDVSDTRDGMGAAHFKKGKMDEAMECFREALRVREILLGPNSEKCANTLQSLGRLHGSLMEFDEAMECYKKSLQIRRDAAEKSSAKIAEVSYEMFALACKNKTMFSVVLEEFEAISLSELLPLGVYNFRVDKARVEARLLYSANKTGERQLFEALSTCEFLSPAAVSIDALPANFDVSLKSIGIEHFSKHLWDDLWRKLGSEWMSSNPFWRDFCSRLEKRIPAAVYITFVPSRSAFEIYAVQKHTIANAKDLLLRKLISICLPNNCFEHHPDIKEYTRWQLRRITSSLEEMRWKHKSVRFSLHLTTTADAPDRRVEGSVSAQEESGGLTKVESTVVLDDSELVQEYSWPQTSGYNDFEMVENLYGSGHKVLGLYIMLQSPETTKELKLAHNLLAKDLSSKESKVMAENAVSKVQEYSSAAVRRTSVSMCCMCWRRVLEQQPWKKGMNAEKDDNSITGDLRGWRLTLCGCVFCRSCFVHSVSMKLKLNTTAQCQRCSSIILAKDCLRIVKPQNMDQHEKDQFERDWKQLSDLSIYNHCDDMVAMSGTRMGCATCHDCQTTTAYKNTKQFFYCRNSKCPNMMCVTCSQVPLTEEAFNRCKLQQCDLVP